MTSSSAIASPSAPNLNFVLACVFNDMPGIGLIVPVLPVLVGTAILGAASHLPAQDWRIGSTFYLCAAMQALAIVVARRYFRAHRP